ncbi:hypothetical protein BKA18_002239 [Streptomyces auratus]
MAAPTGLLGTFHMTACAVVHVPARTRADDPALGSPGREPGLRVHIELPGRPEVTQQHGYFHAGATSAVADSAGGYAAYTLVRAARVASRSAVLG